MGETPKEKIPTIEEETTMCSSVPIISMSEYVKKKEIKRQEELLKEFYALSDHLNKS